MELNLLDLLNQIKKFAIQEKGNIFSLIAYILLALVILSRYFATPFSETYSDYGLYIALFMFLICFLIWLSTRRIHRSRGKINVGIAQVNILNTSMKKTLDSEQKLSISSEISNYIYNRLSHLKQELLMDSHLNYFRLPSRLDINYANCDQIVDDLGINILVWGICRFTDESFHIDYKISIKKRVNSVFFDKLINDINAYPEIKFDFVKHNNLEFDKFMHMVTYLSIIYKSLELMGKFQYKETEKLLLHAINRLNRLYSDVSDQSVNKGDKDVVKIEILMYFILAKNYFNQANSLLENFDYKNEANEKLKKCTQAIDNQMNLMNKYLKNKKYASALEQLGLENEYIYSLGQLGMTKDKKTIKKQLKNVDNILKDKYRLGLVQAFIETIFKNLDDAKKHYEKALNVNSKNRVALRGLGLLEYQSGNYDKSIEYLDKLDSISRLHIFHPHMYDVRLQRTLAKANLKEAKIFSAIKHYTLLMKFKAINKQNLKKNYTL